MKTTVGVVGTGNMGAALVRGWLRSPDPDLSFLVYDTIEERARALAADQRVSVAASPDELVHDSDVIVLVVKPKDTVALLSRLQRHLDERKIVISSAAGVTLHNLREGAGVGPQVFRMMPNLGVELGQGVVALAVEEGAPADTTALVGRLLAPLGLVEVLPEEMFDAVTAASGSSIAFLALVLEAMEDGAVRAGLPRSTARAFLRQTVVAGALLLQAHPGSAADIKDLVSSPSGTTIAGLSVLEDGAVRAAFIQALQAAAERSRQLRDAGRPRVVE